MDKPKKVLILGSGGLAIGQAGEFDYSGSQAIKALKEEGIKTVLINPNIATIQTSKDFADEVYFLPINTYFVEKIIKKEKPDGILLSFGGQIALNCGIELYQKGILKEHNVKVLGTPVDTIINTEDRGLFVHKLNQINIEMPESKAVTTVEEGLAFAKEIGFPVIIRVAFTLGGLGSGFCNNEEELNKKVADALVHSPQVLVEESLKGWKEIEYEVMRDKDNNCMTVCNMENFDPLGIHTGESIVVAPSQTLTDVEYQKLRKISIEVIRHLGIIGECNIQFALDPQSENYRVIEVNARLSRSSALASKATGYPLAFIAAKVALGKSLLEITNPITKKTKAFFEPAMDYIVVKFPRWDHHKFKDVHEVIGSSMKSVGEVMAIGRSFEEALQKAIRMTHPQFVGLTGNKSKVEDIQFALQNPTDKRIFVIAQALQEGFSIDRIFDLTKIDKWFLHKLKRITTTHDQLCQEKIGTLAPPLLHKAKKQGFSDKQIADCVLKKHDFDSCMEIRTLRKQHNIIPVINLIDTLAGEYPAQTNYLYLTYHGVQDDITIENKGIIVLGSGPYSIGSSVEFDWCCVQAIKTLQKEGIPSVMINFNPETVSTDYDECDRLYFEELSVERILDIYDKEQARGIILSMGGQIPNTLALPLQKAGIPILGTEPKIIDSVEDRHKFSQILDGLEVDQPPWKELTSLEAAKQFCSRVGFPVLIRPSYVLSGSAMNVVYKDEELAQYLKTAANISQEHPVVLTKFITNAKEIDMDLVAQKGEVICYAISEHIENAGVHSGDATLVTPPQKLYLETIRRIKKIAKKIVKHLQITGPVNIQFLAKDNHIKIIECNLRASRSFPFVSKVYNLNFIELATKAILGKQLKKADTKAFTIDFVGVKAPQFSFTRLKGADPQLGVEMSSTGEVACLGENVQEAYLKALLSTGFTTNIKTVLLSTGDIIQKAKLLASVKKLHENDILLYATQGTADFYKLHDIPMHVLHWPLENQQPNILDYIRTKKIDLVINIPKNNEQRELSNDYCIRRAAADFSIPLLTNPQCTELFIDAFDNLSDEDLTVKSWNEYHQSID